jgi:pectate lyase
VRQSPFILSVSLCLALAAAGNGLAQQANTPLAFPGAEGYGRHTVGGRGGAVFAVTNLDDSGPGSLRAGIEASGPRTIVFRVSGTINLKRPLKIKNPNLTIAGQTAPGDGITLKGYPLDISADEVIIRYIRVRLGRESGTDADAISSRFVRNLIIDHVSASWSIDETLSVYHCENVTVQWSMITESLFNGGHVKGSHGFGGIWGGTNSSYHHNLIAHHSSRNPRFASGSGNTDFRYNVIYNWGYQGTYGGEAQQVGDRRFSNSTINMVANYYKPGPATAPGLVRHLIVNPWTRRGAADYGRWYVAGNVMEGNDAVTADNWNGGVQFQPGENPGNDVRLTASAPFAPITQHSAHEAYQMVLVKAGASLPKRDSVDERIVAEVRAGSAGFDGPTYKREHKVVDPSRTVGMIDDPADVGGWPVLNSAPAPADADNDGMADDWERQQGLSPSDPADRNKIGAEGYTMLETYLNSLAAG